MYKFTAEEDTFNKSVAEHITIGYTKQLLNTSKNYAKAVKQNQSKGEGMTHKSSVLTAAKKNTASASPKDSYTVFVKISCYNEGN